MWSQSPPFFDVRNYGIDGQWGIERDYKFYLARLDNMMKKIWRVLHPTGSFWVELGDSINQQNGSWYGIPAEFEVNCKKQGWLIISKPIWYKRNAMPLSTKKRFSPKYTNIIGLAKSKDWYFDLDKIRVEPLTQPKNNKFNLRVREGKKGTLEKKFGNKYSATDQEKESHDINGVKKQDTTLGGNGKPRNHYKGFNKRYDHEKILKKGKNPGDFFSFEDDIFDITVKSGEIEHYATFPPELPERIIKACCPPGGWVLDPFMGSGTVGLVAEQLKLNWIGIELNPKYIKIAKERIGI